jgi:2-polyprenyl-3-methyl-5-hydroxy-6-metoxy-1,4-benzoquinol methylase
MTEKSQDKVLIDEAQFHDDWALSEDVNNIDVKQINEAITSPELRFIFKSLGSVRDKKVLDLGCGLGEASVYFALKGAIVTASDLSSEMVTMAAKLAHKNGVEVIPHVASAESMGLEEDEKFDIVYAGNVLHHADIDQTLKTVKQHLKPDGVFVSWDPLAYNPIINVYRWIATSVRTPDERPLNVADLKKISGYFKSTQHKYFWLTSLVIFILMVFVNLKSPNQTRLWKEVVREEKKWQWIFIPLSFIDKLIIAIFPPIRLLCWNVVIIATD